MLFILHTYGDVYPNQEKKKFNFVLTCSVMLMSHISSAHISFVVILMEQLNVIYICVILMTCVLLT